TCSDVGTVQVLLRVFDASGNRDSVYATVNVEDTIAPHVLTKNDTVYLDNNGQASIVPSDVDSGSGDACGIETYALDTFNFDCNNLFNPVTVTLTLTDSNGNTSSNTATVTVLDTIAPTVLATSDTFYLDTAGQIT